jgi:hypothetical protein
MERQFWQLGKRNLCLFRGGEFDMSPTWMEPSVEG